jgi:hypothetical protein
MRGIGIFALVFLGAMSNVGAASPPPMIGIGYEVWFPGIPGGPKFWANRWGTPLMGTYSSGDPALIDQHAEWLSEIGVDFILIDWSNNIANDLSGNYAVGKTVIRNTDKLFAEYKRLDEIGVTHPKVAVLMGAQNQNGFSCQQAFDSPAFKDEITKLREFEERYPNIVFKFEEKPLLGIYLGTPACTSSPSFDDAHFTIRWETGFLGAQPGIYGGNIKNNKFWSWIDREPVPAHRDGLVEAITVTMAFPGQNGWLTPPAQPRHRPSGVSTFAVQWKKAIEYNPRLIFINQWNEFTGNTPTADEFTVEFSNDIEPTVELKCGPMAEVRRAIAELKKIELPALSGKCAAQ